MDIEALREIYIESLLVPPHENRPTKQFFLGTVGLVGAGKTTVIKPLTEHLSLIRISSDETRKLLKEHEYGYEQLMDILMPVAEQFARDGWSIAFDADCGNPKTKELIESLAKECSARIFWIHIDPPEAFIIHKLQTYKHSWLFKNGDEAVANYLQQKEKRQKENTHFDFFATVDTSRSDLAQQVFELGSRIKQESLR